MHLVLINYLGGLCFPRNSVFRLTDRPGMTKQGGTSVLTLLGCVTLLLICNVKVIANPNIT